MYRLEPNAMNEVSNEAAAIAASNRFARVLEIWPGALYEFRRPSGIDFRVSIGREPNGRWAYAVDVTAGARVWKRLEKYDGTGRTPAEALRSAASSIELDEAPLGDLAP